MATCAIPSEFLGRRYLPVLVEYPADAQRPRTRGDCERGERPCPWVSCRHHLAVEVTRKGSVKLDRRFLDGAMPQTCALDVAEDGGHTLEELSVMFGFTRERVRQVEFVALRKMRAAQVVGE